MTRKQAESTQRWVVITYDDPIPTERVILPAFIFFGRAPKESETAEWFLAAEEREVHERRSRRARELRLFALRHVRSWRPHPANVSATSALAADTSAVASDSDAGSGPGPGWDPVMPPASHDAGGS